jgi:hypothetical protein
MLGEDGKGLVLEVVEGGDAAHGEGLHLAFLIHKHASSLLDRRCQASENMSVPDPLFPPKQTPHMLEKMLSSWDTENGDSVLAMPWGVDVFSLTY